MYPRLSFVVVFIFSNQLGQVNGASAALRPSSASVAIASPMAAECLKPWPEQGEATITLSCPGNLSMTKRA